MQNGVYIRIPVKVEGIQHPIPMISGHNDGGNSALRFSLRIWLGALEPRWERPNPLLRRQVYFIPAQIVQRIEIIKRQGRRIAFDGSMVDLGD